MRSRLSGAVLGGVLATCSLAVGLASCGDSPERSASVLVQELASSDAVARRRAAFRLGEMGADARSAVSALLGRLYDPEELVRRACIQALGKIGPSAAPAVPELCAAMLAPNPPELPTRIGGALVAIATPLEDVTSGLTRAHLAGRISADQFSSLVEELGASGAALLPKLVLIAERRDSYRAIAAMERMGPLAAEAVPTLVGILEDPALQGTRETGVGAHYIDWAIAALREIGPPARAAIPALEREAARGNPEAELALRHVRGEVR